MSDNPKQQRKTKWNRLLNTKPERVRSETYIPTTPRPITLPALKFMDGADATPEKGRT